MKVTAEQTSCLPFLYPFSCHSYGIWGRTPIPYRTHEAAKFSNLAKKDDAMLLLSLLCSPPDLAVPLLVHPAWPSVWSDVDARQSDSTGNIIKHVM